MRIGKVGFLRLAAREASDADGIAKAETLQQFGVVIDLAAVPEPRVQKQAVAPGRLILRGRTQAVGAAVGRAERRIALAEIGGLAVNLPAVGFGIGEGPDMTVRDSGRVTELTVEPDADRLKIHRRGVLRSRRELNGRLVEPVIEIFEPGAPVRRKGVFEACAGSPPETHVKRLLLIARRQNVEIAFAGEGKAAAGKSEPRAYCIADPSARRSDKVPLMRDVGARTRER